MIRFLCGLLFILVLMVSGCVVEPVRVTSEPPPPPVGLNVDPNDATKGWITSGGQTVYFKLTANGWAPDDTRQVQNPPSVTTNTPNQYLPMMDFLRQYGLNVEDIDTVTRAYNLMGVRREQAENTKAFLDGLNQSLSGPVPLNEAVNRAQTLKQVNGLIE
ncbi:MAG: hypothetical protein AB7J40_03065 [Candidatus Altimarinota bacterium]